MKSSQKLVLAAIVALIITVLIYDQYAGINVFLTTIVAIGTILFIPELRQKTHWFPIALLLISGIAVAIHGNTYSVIMWSISLIYLAGSFYPGKFFNVPIGLLGGIAGFISSGVSFFMDLPKKHNESKSKKSFNDRFFGILIIIVVPLIFFMLYRGSNAVFSSIISDLEIDIDFGFFFVFLLVFYLFFALCFPKQNAVILALFPKLLDDATPTGKPPMLNIQSSIFYLFIILNILIAFVNTTDLVFLWGGAVLPKGITFAEMIHQGVGTVIVAIIFTIITILAGFGADRLFDPQSRKSVLLAYAWIGQTLIMVLSTAYRNLIYVMDYDLTQKRLGIWLYLLLAAVGLIATVILLKKKKTIWYLIRANATISLAILVATTPFHWDRIIMDYDMYHAENNITVPDYYYLLSLSPHTYYMMEQRLNKMQLNEQTRQILKTVQRKRLEYNVDMSTADFRSRTVYDYILLKQSLN